jgi:predicted anti-sigma-YlaC factor YlaD
VNCQEIQDCATALMDGQGLSLQEREIVKTHLGNCPNCKLDVALEAATRNVIRHRFPHAEVPNATYESIRAMIASDYLY